MISRRVAIASTLVCLLVGALGVALYAQQRAARCAYVPLLAENLLPNPTLAPGSAPGMPDGYGRAAVGVELRGPAIDGEGFDLDGNGRAVQLLGIANYLELPPMAVQPGARYCFAGHALTDSPLGSATRLRVSFLWSDSAGNRLATEHSPWQPVVLWQADATGWSPVGASFRAPAQAATLRVRLSPASDDRVYLDLFAVRQGGEATSGEQPVLSNTPPDQGALAIGPWPHNRRAAVAFTFDWETAMGGLIHSRSLDDPNAAEDPVARGLRMREGITTTLALFEPFDVRATYFATGYNFLAGNPERRRFMGDPTFAWASVANRWRSDRWASTPWFADDPYGTVASDPAWYFADLLGPLQAAGHEIQSHTFSHLYGGLVNAGTWQVDLAAWNSTAAEQGLPPATALAFPWSSSGGMSDANWQTLAANGIRAVTRLSDQAQYNLFPSDAAGLVANPHCQPLPGHEAILACPDFYLTEASADQALAQIDTAVAQGGMIDLWAHTEEVVTPSQIAAWGRVVRYAAEHQSIWVAPFGEIAAWQQARAKVTVRATVGIPQGAGSQSFTITNGSDQNLVGLTIQLPERTTQVALNGDILDANSRIAGPAIVIDLGAGASTEVAIWPAQ